jgi:hypothetical protein
MTAIDHQDRGMTSALSARRRGALAKANLPLPVVLYLFCVVIPIGFQAGPLYLTTLRMLLLVVTVPLMSQILTGRYGRVLVTDILFCAHILWAAVALFVNHSTGQAVEQIGSVGIEFLGGYAIGRAFVRTPETFTALCRVLMAVVCVSLPFVLLESHTGKPFVLELIRGLPGVSTHADFANIADGMRLGLHRSQFTFAHPIHYGLFCSVVMSLAWVGLKGVTSHGWRVTSTLIIGISGFLALSSGALLAIVLQLGLFAWAAVFARVQARWWILVGLGVLAYVVVDILSNRTPVHVFLSYATFSAHTAYWRMIIFEWGMVNVWANPIFGIGLNDWVRPPWMHSGSIDNFWLVMAIRYGVPGFALISIGYLIPLLRIIFRNLSDDPAVNQLRLAWTFTFVGITFMLCTVHIWTNLYSFIFFMFGAGMWLLHYVTPSKLDKHPADDERQLAPRLSFARSLPAESTIECDTRRKNILGLDQGGAPEPSSRLSELPYTRESLLMSESENIEDRVSLPMHRGAQ